MPNLVFEVFDGRGTDAALLYGVRRPQATEHHQPAVEVRRTVVVGQREWTLRFQKPAPMGGHAFATALALVSDFGWR